jgi:hypothetical protein
LDRENIQLERETIREQVFELIDAFPVDMLAEIRDFAEFLQYKRQKKVS